MTFFCQAQLNTNSKLVCDNQNRWFPSWRIVTNLKDGDFLTDLNNPRESDCPRAGDHPRNVVYFNCTEHPMEVGGFSSMYGDNNS